MEENVSSKGIQRQKKRPLLSPTGSRRQKTTTRGIDKIRGRGGELERREFGKKAGRIARKWTAKSGVEL